MFLSDKHNGLDILIDYLSTTQFIMRYKTQSVCSVISLCSVLNIVFAYWIFVGLLFFCCRHSCTTILWLL